MIMADADGRRSILPGTYAGHPAPSAASGGGRRLDFERIVSDQVLGASGAGMRPANGGQGSGPHSQPGRPIRHAPSILAAAMCCTKRVVDCAAESPPGVGKANHPSAGWSGVNDALAHSHLRPGSLW